jgi:hypothetical protein
MKYKKRFRGSPIWTIWAVFREAPLKPPRKFFRLNSEEIILILKIVKNLILHLLGRLSRNHGLQNGTHIDTSNANVQNFLFLHHCALGESLLE